MHGPTPTTRSTRRGARRGPPPGGGPMALMKGEKPRDFKGTMVKLIQYLGSYRLSILIVMLFAAGSTVFAIVGPKILGKAPPSFSKVSLRRSPAPVPHRFRLHWPDHPDHPRIVRSFLSVFLHPG